MSDYDRLLELMRSRRSIRRFSDRAITREDIGRLIEAARWAPSNHNRQPWRFLVIEDKQQLNELADAVRRGLSGKLRSLPEGAAAYIRELMHYATFFSNAPVLLLVLHKQPVSVSAPLLAELKHPELVSGEPLSVAMAVQNLLLAARAWGLCADRPVAGSGRFGRAFGSARRARPDLFCRDWLCGGIAAAAAEEEH